MSRKKDPKDKTSAQDEAWKSAGPTPNETLPVQTFDEYQCTGNAETDFPALCALLNVKDIPAVIAKFPASQTEDYQLQTSDSFFCSKPCLTLELESKDRARSMKVSGWRVNEQIFRALQKMLPSMNQLQSLGFWQAGLTDRMVVALMNTIPLCSSLRVVALEGNVLPQQGYHLLLSEDSVLTHLSLRNNRIGVEGARLIGSALSTARSANKNLLSLNLAFNRICDAGAALIAQGLRLNRSLLFLSLCNNQVGDAGAAQLAAVLREFALTHEEIVERRKLLLKRVQAALVKDEPLQTLAGSTGETTGTPKKKEATRKDEKPDANKDNQKPNKKTTDTRASQARGGKAEGKEKQHAEEDTSNTCMNKAELVDSANPLLHPSVDPRDGQVFMPGNTTLVSLNLAGNRITEKSLPHFLASLQAQGEGESGGLLRLCLQRNIFPPENELYVKIKEMMAALDPMKKNNSEEEGLGE
ncbi:leucine-rich repeat-containing protein 71 [Neolamprologus brichardi]|uniref:leucine-rich repeat-containing protein 71 n=1 Tax=Neolamprologus brichardi TaxID=32507 RepID=UPI0003EC01AA|nr:leucine-rich repeat-containing protein 71 [Neolamprologus brichardi]